MRRYIKHRKKLPREAPSRFAQLPKVTVQLPLYNERFVVARLLEETLKLDYPRELLQIQVLDDSTDETHPYTERLCNEYMAAGFPIEYRHRTNRHGYKAGALQEGLESATGELIAIFDADFIPPVDFLMRTVHYFADPGVGVVQTRWSYLNKEYSILTQVEAMLLDGHFVLEHGARCGSGLFFNFNGTAGVLRRTMIDDAGGWQHETLTEDSDLSYRAQLNGWRFVYVPSVDCPSELPVETYGFQVQQSRWAKGLTQVAKKLLPRILKANLPLRVKVEAVMHLTPNISYPLMIVVSALMLPVMIVRFYMGWFQMVLIDFPLIIASFWSISAFYLYAQKELYPKTWWKSIAFLPMLMAAGVALTVSNTKAVLEAILGIQTSFRPNAEVRHRHREDENPDDSLSPPQRLAPIYRDSHRLLFRLHGRFRDRHLQLPGDPISDAVCRRLLLGRLQHALSGISRQSRVAESPQTRRNQLDRRQPVETTGPASMPLRIFAQADQVRQNPIRARHA